MIDAPARGAGRPRARLDRRGIIAVLLVLVAALAVSRGCQQSQVRISKEQAIATAQRLVDFKPERTQVRLVRQGLGSNPFWAVSLSVPEKDGSFSQLATVRINANTGKVAAVNRGEAAQ